MFKKMQKALTSYELGTNEPKAKHNINKKID